MAKYDVLVSEKNKRNVTVKFNLIWYFVFLLLGAGSSTDIKEGMKCKVECSNAIATPDVINCLNTGWDAERNGFLIDSLFQLRNAHV